MTRGKLLVRPEWTTLPGGNISPAEWSGAQSDIAEAQIETQRSSTRVFDTRAYASLQATIDAAEAAGGGEVFVAEAPTPGLDIVLKDKVYLSGRGIGATTIDVNTITGTGSVSALPNPSTTISKNGRTVTFASAHGLQPGDVFIIYNPTDYSFSPARTYYRGGEFCRVRSVTSAATVTLTAATFASYSAGTVVAYKVNPIRTGVSNMTVNCTAAQTGIKVTYGADLVFDNLKMQGSRISHLTLNRCYNVSMSRFVASDYQAPVGGVNNNYGITVSNCQRLRINQADLETYRHGFATGGDNGICSVPNRDIIISDSYINGLSDAFGVTGCNLHGNSEYVQFNNCIIPSGLTVAGDFITYRGCDIRSAQWGCAVFSAEMLGVSITFENNIFTSNGTHPVSQGMIYLGFGANVLRTGGNFRFKNNFINMDNTQIETLDATMAMRVILDSTGALTGLRATIKDNEFYTRFGPGTGARTSCRFDSTGTAQWDAITIQDNTGTMDNPYVASGSTLPHFIGEGLAVPTFAAYPGSMYRRIRKNLVAATALYINRDGSTTWRAIDV